MKETSLHCHFWKVELRGGLVQNENSGQVPAIPKLFPGIVVYSTCKTLIIVSDSTSFPTCLSVLSITYLIQRTIGKNRNNVA